MEQSNDLRASSDRRADERRGEIPESAKPFMGFLVPEERRQESRRQAERRGSD